MGVGHGVRRQKGVGASRRGHRLIRHLQRSTAGVPRSPPPGGGRRRKVDPTDRCYGGQGAGNRVEGPSAARPARSARIRISLTGGDVRPPVGRMASGSPAGRNSGPVRPGEPPPGRGAARFTWQGRAVAAADAVAGVRTQAGYGGGGGTPTWQRAAARLDDGHAGALTAAQHEFMVASAEGVRARVQEGAGRTTPGRLKNGPCWSHSAAPRRRRRGKGDFGFAVLVSRRQAK